MTFTELSSYFEHLEATASRITMTEILAKLFKSAKKDDIGKICYLLQGRVAPLYVPLEFGMADKMVIRSIVTGLGVNRDEVVKVFKREGDLGTAAELLGKGKQGENRHLKISEVYKECMRIAQASGLGSQDEKIRILGNLIRICDALSVRYIVRIPLGKLRLGFSDMTILDALSWMLTGGKGERKRLEKAYNVRPDLAYIAERAKEKGVAGLSHIAPAPGTPILMARANRLSSAVEILEKIGSCAIEYKYDGLRLQVHRDDEKVWMFSRNLEDITAMFPDIKRAVLKQVTAKRVIIEGEVVAYNPESGAFVPFQETMQRKRKYNIEEKAAEIPVKLFCFELLLSEGKSFIEVPYNKRKQELKRIVTGTTTLVYAQETVVDTARKIDDIFEDAVEKHFEGIIAKKPDGVYEAGVRGWNWIKYKRAMNKKLSDTLDVLVMGYTRGEGKRTSFGVGQFLTGVYDKTRDKFVTVAKIGTGLSDEQFRDFFKRAQKLHARVKPPLYEIDKLMQPDVWLEPELVVEVSCDEITRSPVHTAGRVMEQSKSGKALSVKTPGYALRFPRMERIRSDKRPQDATTVGEITAMYKAQTRI